MQAAARVTIRRLHPRTLGGVLLVLALAAESYMMSRHTAAGSAREALAMRSPPVRVAPLACAALGPACSAAAFDEAEQTLEKFTNSTSIRQIPLSQLKSNPFQQESSSTGGAAGNTPVAVDRAAVLNAVASLELESVAISQTRRSCTINNTACEEGQQIDGFTIETIANGSVTVSRGIYRFELTLHN
jgi:hypothetical protein